MNRKLLFMMFGIFMFLILLYVPAKAEDIMSWSPRMFAGGAFATQEDLLNTAIVIKHGSKSLAPYYSYSEQFTTQNISIYAEGYSNEVSANVTASGG